MSSVKYTRLQDLDRNESIDFSSIFTYNDKKNVNQNQSHTFTSNSLDFRSIFTYGDRTNLDKFSTGLQTYKTCSQLSTDKLARFFVLMGYFVMYIVMFPVIIWFTLKKIPENERLVVFRLGHYHRSTGPGLVMVFPLIDKYHKVTVNLKAFSVPPKQVITADRAIVEMGADIYFQVVDAEKSVTCVQNLDLSTRVLVQTALCNILVQKTLPEIEAERMSIANALLVSSNRTCTKWGVTITRAELSQIKVLQKPPPKKPAQLMMPPGLFNTGGASGGLPLQFAQLAQAISETQGPDKSEAISHLLQTVVGGLVAGQPSTQLASEADSMQLLINQKPPCPADQLSSGTSSHSLSEAAYSPALLDPGYILSMIKSALSESVVQKVGETFQFEISGPGAGTYYLDLKHGSGFIGQGPDPSSEPAAILSLSFTDLQSMLLGELKPFQAYMSGRLGISGDIGAAMKLEELGTRIQQVQKRTIVTL